MRTDRRSQVDGKGVRGVRGSRLAGVALRAWSGRASAYGFVTELGDVSALVDRVERVVRSSARRNAHGFPSSIAGKRASYRPSVRAPASADDADIVEMLNRAQVAAERVEPGTRCVSSFGVSTRDLLVVDSAGGRVETSSLHSTLLIHAVHRTADRVGDHAALAGGERGLAEYVDDASPEALGEAAARYAAESARAAPAPAGRFRVLTDHHLTGLLAHESFGHLTEYDLVAPGWSLLKGRRGEKLADARLSITDAPVPPDGGRHGVHVPVDDEGTTGRRLPLLDRGTLTGWMHHRGSAVLEGDAPTGNGRALDVRFPPIVRMRNTYFEPGDLTVEEALEALGDGLYLIGGRGGAPHSDGSFMFTSQRGYRVEGGEIKEPVRGACIYGNILSFLPNVEGLTRDFGIFTNTFGGCGKWDQSFLHVGVGGPHLLAGDVLVGGAIA